MTKFEDGATSRSNPADTYRLQDSCANCAHVFIREEHEGNDELYCTFNAPPRPPCMSVFMGEYELVRGQPFGFDIDGYRKWDEWKAGVMQVAVQGICGEWLARTTDAD